MINTIAPEPITEKQTLMVAYHLLSEKIRGLKNIRIESECLVDAMKRKPSENLKSNNVCEDISETKDIVDLFISLSAEIEEELREIDGNLNTVKNMIE